MSTSTKLHVESRGPDTGTTIMWVHGVDSDLHVWDHAINQVSKHQRCLAIDLPGHGRSPSPDNPDSYTRDAVLEDLDNTIGAIRTANPAERLVYVGHSLGGYLGMAHALTRTDASIRIDGLVLVSTGPGFRDPDAMASWNERVAANASKYSVSEAAASIAFHVDSLVIDHITELTLPIALVIGEQDKAFLGANDYLQKKLPNATRTTVDGARHFVMKTNPESVSEAVDTIVRSLDSR